MSTVNVYFSQGTRNEQHLIEDLIIESLKIYGQEFFYIPRTLVSKDEILGEDRLSEFKSSFPIEMYFENVDSNGFSLNSGSYGWLLPDIGTIILNPMALADLHIFLKSFLSLTKSNVFIEL